MSLKKSRLIGYLVLASVAMNCRLNEVQAFQLAITNRNFPGAGALIQTQLNQLADNIQTQFNQTIASASNQSDFLNAVGNANAFSARSFLAPGVVPANKTFFVNAGGSAAIALGNGASLSSGITFPKNQLPPIGVSAKAGFTVGVSGRMIPIPLPLGLDSGRMMYSFSFLSADLSNQIGRGITLKTSQTSLGASYQLYVPQAWTPLARFDGIRITSGLSYSTFDASYRTPFNLSSFDSGTNSTVTWNSNVDLGVRSQVFSLTNEVKTGVRMLWLLDVYTGIGLDFNFGSSAITGGSSGPVSGTSSGTTVFSATATLDGESASAAPTLAQFRYLLGTQVDLGPVGIYVQGQVSTPSVYALNFGAHVAF
ncbi:MAG: hypothetical protein H7333_09830 [Bdellovibrionales bacterium]|nr:hypothetical protein [Oligoflexia bacterium]